MEFRCKRKHFHYIIIYYIINIAYIDDVSVLTNPVIFANIVFNTKFLKTKFLTTKPTTGVEQQIDARGRPRHVQHGALILRELVERGRLATHHEYSVAGHAAQQCRLRTPTVLLLYHSATGKVTLLTSFLFYLFFI